MEDLFEPRNLPVLSFEEAAPVLEAVGMAEARHQSLDLEDLACDQGVPVQSLRAVVESAERAGLMLSSPKGQESVSRLTRAGRQYLALRGRVDRAALFFLPNALDDLHAREALYRGGYSLLHRFGDAIGEGRGVEFARGLVPATFASAVDDRLAFQLSAAAAALMARMSVTRRLRRGGLDRRGGVGAAGGRAAGCVGEEIIAIALPDEAMSWLEMRREAGEIDDPEMKLASGAVRRSREILGSPDAHGVFRDSEPRSDAIAGDSRGGRESSAAPGPEEWFKAFPGVIATGHLEGRWDERKR